MAAQALAALAQKLLAVCKNPQQPGFNHYLFESVAGLIRYGCEANAAMVLQFEESLFPAFQVVLSVRLRCLTKEGFNQCLYPQDCSSQSPFTPM